MVVKASSIQKKINKIIGKNNLGSTLVIKEYSTVMDDFGTITKTLTNTIDTSGARIDIDLGNKARQDGTPFNTNTIELIIPVFSINDSRYYEFTWMGDNYKINDRTWTTIGQIQDTDIVYQFKLERIKE